MTRSASLASSRRGATAAEFTIVLPLLLVFLFGIIDAGRYMWAINRSEKAVQAGARFAIVTNTVPEGLQTYSFVSATNPPGSPIPVDAFGSIKSEHGPDAIAGLASSRATNEDCYVMQRLMRAAVGTHNIDNCSRVCHSPTSFALRKSFGLSGATGSFDDIEEAELALLIGVNPTQGHPVVGARIKQHPHSNGGFRRRRMAREPVRVAEAGAMIGDVEEVLHAHREPGKRSRARSTQRHMVVAAERAGGVIEQYGAQLSHCGR